MPDVGRAGDAAGDAAPPRRRRAPSDVALAGQAARTLGGDHLGGLRAARRRASGSGCASSASATGDRVAVLAENRPEWVLADLGTQGIGGVTVGRLPDELRGRGRPRARATPSRRSSSSRTRSSSTRPSLVRDQLPHLEQIVVIDTRGIRSLEDPADDEPRRARGARRSTVPAVDRASGVTPSHRCTADRDVAIIVYTSGAAGPPQGAMLSHANLARRRRRLDHRVLRRPSRRGVLSYLPLCHIAERLVSVSPRCGPGYVVNFGEGGESFPNDLREVQPTFFLGVPRVWERLAAGVSSGSRTPAGSSGGTTSSGSGAVRSSRPRGMRGAAPRQCSSAFLGVAVPRPVAAKEARHVADPGRALRRGADRPRRARVLLGARRPGPRGLRADREHRPGHGHTRRRRAHRQGRPAAARRRGAHRRRRRDPRPQPGELPRLPRRRGGDERRVRSTDGCRPATSASSTTTASSRSRTARRTSSSPRPASTSRPPEIENLLKFSPFVRDAMVIGDRRPYLAALIGIELGMVSVWAQQQNLPFTTQRDLIEKPEVRQLIESAVNEVNREVAEEEQHPGVRAASHRPRGDGRAHGDAEGAPGHGRRQFSDLIEWMYAA